MSSKPKLGFSSVIDEEADERARVREVEIRRRLAEEKGIYCQGCREYHLWEGPGTGPKFLSHCWQHCGLYQVGLDFDDLSYQGDHCKNCGGFSLPCLRADTYFESPERRRAGYSDRHVERVHGKA